MVVTGTKRYVSDVPNLGSIVVVGVVTKASVPPLSVLVPLFLVSVSVPSVPFLLPVPVGDVGVTSGPPIGGCPVGTAGRLGFPIQSAYLCPKIAKPAKNHQKHRSMISIWAVSDLNDHHRAVVS